MNHSSVLFQTMMILFSFILIFNLYIKFIDLWTLVLYINFLNIYILVTKEKKLFSPDFWDMKMKFLKQTKWWYKNNEVKNQT